MTKTTDVNTAAQNESTFFNFEHLKNVTVGALAIIVFATALIIYYPLNYAIERCTDAANILIEQFTEKEKEIEK